MTDDQQDDPLATDDARRRRRGRRIVRGSAIAVIALVAGAGLGLELPAWLRDREERRSRACFEALGETGRGQPGACVARLGFHGLRGADRDAAASLERDSAVDARAAAVDLAIWRDVDAEARDMALRAQVTAGDGDDAFLIEGARIDGAYALAAELARDAAAGLDPVIAYRSVVAAAVIGDLDAIRAIAAPRVVAGDDGWGDVLGCLVGLACAPVAGDRGLAGAVAAAQAKLDRGRPLEEVVAALGGGDLAVDALRTPWTIAIVDGDAAPEAIEKLAAALEAAAAASSSPPPPPRQQGAPPLPVLPDPDAVAALMAAWTLEIEAARIHAAIGDPAAAGRALIAADRIAADPRVDGALAVADTAGLRVAALPPAEAIAWLDRVGAIGPIARLNRALALAAGGKLADALGALDDVSPYTACTVDNHVCEALAWTKLALLIRTGAVLPAPPDAGGSPGMEARRRVAIGATDADQRAAMRWALRDGSFDDGGLATPMVMYALGTLASRDLGEDPDVLLSAAIGPQLRPRRFAAAMQGAALLRMDDASANEWLARRVRIDAAISGAPADARVALADAL